VRWRLRGRSDATTHTRRQATQHDCLSSLLGDGDKWSKIVYGEEKVYFVLGRLEQPRQDKNLLYWHDKPKEPTKEGHLYLYSLSPHSPQFQHSARATPLYSLSDTAFGMEETPKRRITSSFNKISTDQLGNSGGGECPHPFLQHRYLKTTWTFFSSNSDTCFTASELRYGIFLALIHKKTTCRTQTWNIVEIVTLQNKANFFSIPVFVLCNFFISACMHSDICAVMQWF